MTYPTLGSQLPAKVVVSYKKRKGFVALIIKEYLYGVKFEAKSDDERGIRRELGWEQESESREDRQRERKREIGEEAGKKYIEKIRLTSKYCQASN